MQARTGHRYIPTTHRLMFAGDWAPGAVDVCPLKISFPLVLNLEGPVLEPLESNVSPAEKVGPVLANANLPESAGPTYLGLANNHIMDFRDLGLQKTLDLIRQQQGCEFFGAGAGTPEASQPLLLSTGETTIALLARTERQFGVASPSSPGAAGLDGKIFADIQEARALAEHVVLLLHGGAEMVPFPSPDRKASWRAFIESGASVVIGNHTHVASGWENYKEGVIFYGLGNFCVDPEKWSWHPQGLWSVTPILTFYAGRFDVELKTSVSEKKDGRIAVRPSTAIEFQEHLDCLAALNIVVENDLILDGLWQRASVAIFHLHFEKWLGFSRPPLDRLKASAVRAIKGIARVISNKSDPFMTRKQKLLWYHCFSVDAHRDVIETALGVLSGERPDNRNLAEVETASNSFGELIFSPSSSSVR